MTVIMSLHELDLAQKISDQVICVHGDHIEKYGAPEEIFTSDYIRRLYGITRGSYNAEFGCVEMEPPTGEPQVFVIGGNGSGIPVYRKLQRQGIPFATGILHTNDADYQVAKELAAETITEKPFQCISEENYRKALEVMEKCREVYCPLKDFGPVNEKNRELIKKQNRWENYKNCENICRKIREHKLQIPVYLCYNMKQKKRQSGIYIWREIS